jgi:hypothetical protein
MVVALLGACTTQSDALNPAGAGPEDQGGTSDTGNEAGSRTLPAVAAGEAGTTTVVDASAPDASADGALADAGDSDAGDHPPCPAPAPDPKEFVLSGDSTAAGWGDYGFSGPTTHEATRVCSGTEAVAYTTSHQYDGFSFTAKGAASAVAASHFSARIYVSKDSDWTVAAEPLSGDAHCYRLPLANCGEGDSACGSGQKLAPCIQHWKAGWQDVELAIPASTVNVGAILFEQFTVGSIEVAIDDVRLTPR